MGQIDSLPGCYDDEVAMGKQLDEIAMGWFGQNLRPLREARTAATRFLTGMMEGSWSVGGFRSEERNSQGGAGVMSMVRGWSPWKPGGGFTTRVSLGLWTLPVLWVRLLLWPAAGVTAAGLIGCGSAPRPAAINVCRPGVLDSAFLPPASAAPTALNEPGCLSGC